MNALLVARGDAKTERDALEQCVQWSQTAFSFHVAQTREEGLAILAAQKIDLVLLDSHVPMAGGGILQGKEFLVEFRHKGFKTTACMFSSNEQQNYNGCFSGAELAINKEKFLREFAEKKSFEEMDKLASLLNLVTICGR